jgi:hypothetical protein
VVTIPFTGRVGFPVVEHRPARKLRLLATISSEASGDWLLMSEGQESNSIRVEGELTEQADGDFAGDLEMRWFERVTGLTIGDFRLLNQLGLLNAQNMNAAIYQFRAFERASLHYAEERMEEHVERVGLWDHAISEDELGHLDAVST